MFKEKVIYQIYPKSFKDTSGNGIGDLKGIIEKIPYLAELGVDMLWLNPIFPSPQNDNGYDIKDYKAIDPLFGTMDDFERLVKIAKEHQIEIMLDMVLNHVSTEHPWFKKALAGEKQYQDYFILRDTPTNWRSKFGGSAWSAFGTTGKYYLHLYDKTQADLNWRNPEVRQALADVVRFWQEKGVKGFRFDVINVIGKDKVLKDNARFDGKPEYTDRPITHTYLKELNQATYGSDPEIITVGEMSFTTVKECILYTQPERHELNMTFNFHHLKVDYENGQKWTDVPFDFDRLKQLFNEWGSGMSEHDGWNAWFWNNHDQPRALNRFVDIENFREEGATMLASAIHLNRGTPYIYMGEEIGMVDPTYHTIDDYVDIESKNAYQELIASGMSSAQAFNLIQKKSRDNARIPMQWDATPNAGFTDGTPWLAVDQQAQVINVEQAMQQGTIFPYYQKLIALRKSYPVISRGSYEAFLPDHPQVYGFIRRYEEQELLVVNNFYAESTKVVLPERFIAGKVLLSNSEYPSIEKTVTLQPYQSLALLIE